MKKKTDNKIAIPWYKRNIKGIGKNDIDINSLSFNFPNFPKGTTPRNAIRQPVRVPVTSPVTSPVFSPSLQPETEPFNYPKPLPLPIPSPIPLPERKTNNGKPEQSPQPALPLFPVLTSEPNYDWNKHWEHVINNLPQEKPAIEPVKKSLARDTIGTILKPVMMLFMAREGINEYVKVNISDPVYSRMLKDPVLGTVLREGEKANIDAETLGTILANFDWENGNYKELEKTLAVSIGVAGAARLMVFIIGRKILFRL